MADLLIRNVRPEVVADLDAHAERLGVSRAELMRQVLEEQAQRIRSARRHRTVDDLKATASRLRGVLDDELMKDAWS